MQPTDQAAAILNHYFAQLAERCGAAWSDRNAADIERACELMGDGVAPADVIPPYQAPIVSDRQTVSFEREPPRQSDYERRQWAEFENWRSAKLEEERIEAARRIMRR